MRRSLVALLFIAAAVSGALDPSEAIAQDYDPDTPISSEPFDEQSAAGAISPDGDGVPAVQSPYAGSAELQASPERNAPPRTLRAHWHVFIAFALIWLLLFGYALTIGRRLKQVEDEIRVRRRPSE
jgi:CcmD family protein